MQQSELIPLYMAEKPITEVVLSDASKNQILALPFASGKANVPMHVASSGMFSSSNNVASSTEGYFKDVLCYSDEKIKVLFSGHLLNQDDADVLMTCIELINLSQIEPGERISLLRSVIVSELEKLGGWSYNGNSYSRLLASFKRLNESFYYLESADDDGSKDKKSIPLKMLNYVQDGDYIYIGIPKHSQALYQNVTMLDWSKRKALGSRNHLAKALQFYMAGFPEKRIFKVELSKIKSIARAKSPDSKFVSALEKGFAELERVGVISEYWIKKENTGWWCGWSIEVA